MLPRGTVSFSVEITPTITCGARAQTAHSWMGEALRCGASQYWCGESYFSLLRHGTPREIWAERNESWKSGARKTLRASYFLRRRSPAYFWPGEWKIYGNPKHCDHRPR